MKKKTVRDVAVRGKKVLVRVDFNVPLNADRRITDDKRIRESLPTIRYLLEEKARVILISHLGRPKGKVVDDLRLDPMAKRLSELLGKAVKKLDESMGDSVRTAVEDMADGDVIILENIRFYPQEEKNEKEFAQKLSELGDLFVLDAFGTAHRAHASTVGLAAYLPAVAGLLMEKEITVLGRALENPAQPFVAIIGGAKVSDKIAVLDNLLEIADTLLIGGGMANTFLKAKGYSVGTSLLEEDKVDTAGMLLKKAESLGKRLLLPVDVVIAEQMKEAASVRTVKAESIPDGWMALDIGDETRRIFAEYILQAQTVIWNGPMGVFEMEPFSEGTRQITAAVAGCAGTTIVGGGDSAAAVEKFGRADDITHISTGGGASLEFMEGKVLPGVAALSDH